MGWTGHVPSMKPGPLSSFLSTNITIISKPSFVQLMHDILHFELLYFGPEPLTAKFKNAKNPREENLSFIIHLLTYAFSGGASG